MASSMRLPVHAVLRARFSRTDEVALSLDDAPAFHNNGVAQHPLQLPVSHAHVLRSLLYCILECGS